MGVFNCEGTLAESIDSLLAQTYKDFEIVICDDGSTDNTLEIAKKYADANKNIVLLKNEENKGLNYTLNYCLKHAKGEYIARHDGDDISLPDRFEKEMKIFESNPSVSIVGSNVISFNENGDFKFLKFKEFPQKKDLVFGSPLCHATCIFRKSVLVEVEGYSESKNLLRVEDYNLFCKIYAKGYTGYNIQEPLYKWRDDFSAYKRRTFKNRLNEVYARFIGYRMLKFPLYTYVYCLRPILVWLMPRFLYDYFHTKNRR